MLGFFLSLYRTTRDDANAFQRSTLYGSGALCKLTSAERLDRMYLIEPGSPWEEVPRIRRYALALPDTDRTWAVAVGDMSPSPTVRSSVS